MKTNFKTISLLLWVTQFGFSVLFPTCFFLLLGTWLRNRYQLGLWVVVLCGVLGLLTTVSTVRSCMRALRKASEEAGNRQDSSISFNDHE